MQLNVIYNLSVNSICSIPVVGFWGFSPSGAQMEFTTLPTNPAITPYFQSRFSNTMTFFERLYNTYLKVTIHEPLMRKIRESTF